MSQQPDQFHIIAKARAELRYAEVRETDAAGVLKAAKLAVKHAKERLAEAINAAIYQPQPTKTTASESVAARTYPPVDEAKNPTPAKPKPARKLSEQDAAEMDLALFAKLWDGGMRYAEGDDYAVTAAVKKAFRGGGSAAAKPSGTPYHWQADYQVRGPAFWFAVSSHNCEPNLIGAELVARVRKVMDQARAKDPDATSAPQPEPTAPTWRSLTLAAAGFVGDDEDAWSEEIATPILEAGVVTCGDLADRLLAGQLFGMERSDLDPVYAAIEMLSEDDEHPISFDAEFEARASKLSGVPTAPTAELAAVELKTVPGLTANVLKKLAAVEVNTVGQLWTWADEEGTLDGGMADMNGVGLMSAMMGAGVGCKPASTAGSAVYSFLKQHGCDPRVKSAHGARVQLPDPLPPDTEEPAAVEEPASEPASPTEQPPRDRTEAWERRLAADGAAGTAQNPDRLRKQIAEYRDDQKANNAHPMWGYWSEFDVELPTGELVRVVAKPSWDDEPSRHHIEFWSDKLSETGYWSEIVKKEPGLLIEWARQYIADRVKRLAEESAEKKAEEPAAKPKRAKKPAAAKAVAS